MGLFKKLFSGAGGSGASTNKRQVVYPDPAFPEPVDAIAELFARLRGNPDAMWGTIEVPGQLAPDGEPISIEVLPDSINMIERSLDPALLQELSLVEDRKKNYTMPAGDARQAAGIVDTLLRRVFSLTGRYELKMTIEN